jgi:hypothetical protein
MTYSIDALAIDLVPRTILQPLDFETLVSDAHNPELNPASTAGI